MTCEHEEFSRIPGAPYQYREFLGALLREPAFPRLAEGEALASMASLLYVDDDGRCLIGALAERAGVAPLAFVERYLDAYLTPILHCFFAHELFFVAHGENTVLVLEEGVPRRVILKDLVEEVQVSRDKRATLPDSFRGLLYDIADELIPLFFLTDIIDGFFRYLADVLVTCLGVAEEDFWRAVARTVVTYQEAHPELAPKFAKWDLFAPTFPRFCLNKYRLVLFGYGDVADNVLDLDPKFDGVLDNPIAPFAPKGADRG